MVSAILLNLVIALSVVFVLKALLSKRSSAARSMSLMTAYLLIPALFYWVGINFELREISAMALAVVFSSSAILWLCFTLFSKVEVPFKKVDLKWHLIALVFSITFTVLVSLYSIWVEVPQQQILNVGGEASGLESVFILLFAILGAPLIEEILFRGGLFDALLPYYSENAVVLISGLIFGCIHLEVPQAMPLLVVLGWALGWLRIKSQSLWPALVLHGLNNTIVVILMLLN